MKRPDSELRSAVEAALSLPSPFLSFPLSLERRYIADISASSIANLRVITAAGVGLSLLYMVVDYFSVPDVTHMAWSLRGCEAAAFLIFFGLAAIYKFNLIAVEIGASAVTLMSLIIAVFILSNSHAPDRLVYGPAVIVSIWYPIIFLPTRAKIWLPAAGIAALIALGFAGYVVHAPVPRAVRMFTSSIFTLMAVFIAYRQEFQRRRTYLLTLRHVLLNSDLLLRNEHLRDLADRDELTGLLNRRGVRDIMAGMVDGSRKEDLTYGVMLLDIDEFKAYNDYYGHLAGDECLRQVAEEFRNALRETDLAARFGGEEFLAVLPSQDLVGCLRAADNVRSRIQKRGLPHLARRPGAPPCVTVSIGVACTRPGQSLSFNDLVQAADEQLYRAKEHGRNAVFPLVAV